MKKILTAATAAAMLLSATAASAATRPEVTRLSAPVAGASNLANDDDEEGGDIPVGAIVLGVGGLLALIFFMGTHHGNSPR